MRSWKREAKVNVCCGLFIAAPVLAFDGPLWGAWAVFGVIYAVFTASDRVARLLDVEVREGGDE